uniref:Putative secreted protein n=1 Tax=Anopheles marajoara TaxID=58244 RepID=A0A2M4CE78_9DIPT
MMVMMIRVLVNLFLSLSLSLCPNCQSIACATYDDLQHRGALTNGGAIQRMNPGGPGGGKAWTQITRTRLT